MAKLNSNKSCAATLPDGDQIRLDRDVYNEVMLDLERSKVLAEVAYDDVCSEDARGQTIMSLLQEHIEKIDNALRVAEPIPS